MRHADGDDLTRLLLAAQAGDAAAETAFVRRTQAEVWRLVAHLADRSRADDVTQEVYLRAFRALPRYRAEASARTWLLTIARTTAIDAVRATTRRRRLDARFDRERHADHASDVTGVFDLEALVDSLDPDRRAAFVLTQVVGLGYEEAAAVVGCPVGTIRSRVFRARADLVALVADGEADGAADVDVAPPPARRVSGDA